MRVFSHKNWAKRTKKGKSVLNPYQKHMIEIFKKEFFQQAGELILIISSHPTQFEQHYTHKTLIAFEIGSVLRARGVLLETLRLKTKRAIRKSLTQLQLNYRKRRNMARSQWIKLAY